MLEDARVAPDAAPDPTPGDPGGDAGPDASADAAVPAGDCPDACDDGIDCTEDECISGGCSHLVDRDACDAQDVCNLLEGGCVPAAPCSAFADCADDDPCTRDETCNMSLALCDFALFDGDEDGHVPVGCGGDDFDDVDPLRYPGATDFCDGADDDDDGMVDEEPEATESCSGGTECEDGFCPLCLDDADQQRLDDFDLLLLTFTCSSLANPKACPNELEAQATGVSRMCWNCLVVSAECLKDCGGSAFCPSSAGLERDCIESCEDVFEECAGGAAAADAFCPGG